MTDTTNTFPSTPGRCRMGEHERLLRLAEEANIVIGGWNRVWEATGKPGPLGKVLSDCTLAEVERMRAVVEAAVEFARERDAIVESERWHLIPDYTPVLMAVDEYLADTEVDWAEGSSDQ